jgi:hypothetical protein
MHFNLKIRLSDRRVRFFRPADERVFRAVFLERSLFRCFVASFFVAEVINNRVKRTTPKWLDVPLTEAVEFKTVLQRGNCIQPPKLIRWKFNIETNQILKVTMLPAGSCTGESFYAKMDKSGRITIPKLILKQLGRNRPDVSLTGAVMLVRLEPA